MSRLALGHGWRRQLEDRDYLRTAGLVFGVPRIMQDVPAFSARKILTVRSQLGFSCCTGEAGAYAGQSNAWIDTKGKQNPVFSSWWSYIAAQRASGMLGRDEGATISGLAKGCATEGFALESECPLPKRYTSRVSSATAAGHRLLKFVKIRSFAEFEAWQKNGFGPVVGGITWTRALADCWGRVSLSDTKGRGLGHAVCWWGWTESGEWDQINSHGTEWGDQGWALWSRDAITSEIERGDTEFIGFSDVENFDSPRELVGDWGGNG